MAYIKKINFSHVGKSEGCLCDRCGQYIMNIWTVEYRDGVRMHFGIDCFDKLNKSKLTAYGMKLMKKALKSIQTYQELMEAEMLLTEETDEAYKAEQVHYDWQSDSYWRGKPWKDYHEWRLNKFFPARFASAQKEIDRFKNVNFDR